MRQWGVVGFRGRKVSLPCLILSREQFLYFHNRTFFGLNLLYFFNLPQAFALGGRDILLLEYPLSFSHRDILFQLSLIFFFFFFSFQKLGHKIHRQSVPRPTCPRNRLDL